MVWLFYRLDWTFNRPLNWAVGDGSAPQAAQLPRGPKARARPRIVLSIELEPADRSGEVVGHGGMLTERFGRCHQSVCGSERC